MRHTGRKLTFPKADSAMTDPLLSRLQRVLDETAQNGRFALAYSGGLDSRFLAYAAQLLHFQPVLLHVTGPHVPSEESDFARSWADGRHLAFREVVMNTLSVPTVAEGARDRCYACKLTMFSRLAQESNLPLCDGTNASDVSTYRPGIRAVRELGVTSPLALAGLAKKDIHFLAEKTGMDLPRQKPRPCLLTRLPYGMKPDAELLAGIAAGESVVRHALARAGLPQIDFRLRLVAPGRLELHLTASDMTALPSALGESLLQDIHAVMPGLPRPVLSAQETLSGFFDRVTA